jgi:hypothetical protein
MSQILPMGLKKIHKRESDEWNDYVADMKAWSMVYDALSFVAEMNLIGVLALKAHISNSISSYEALLSPREMEYFKTLVAAKKAVFDPEQKIALMTNKLLCITLNSKSHLTEQLSRNKICGVFLGLNPKSSETMLLNENGEYERKETPFSFSILYPDDNTTVVMSLPDISNLEEF